MTLARLPRQPSAMPMMPRTFGVLSMVALRGGSDRWLGGRRPALAAAAASSSSACQSQLVADLVHRLDAQAEEVVELEVEQLLAGLDLLAVDRAEKRLSFMRFFTESAPRSEVDLEGRIRAAAVMNPVVGSTTHSALSMRVTRVALSLWPSTACTTASGAPAARSTSAPTRVWRARSFWQTSRSTSCTSPARPHSSTSSPKRWASLRMQASTASECLVVADSPSRLLSSARPSSRFIVVALPGMSKTGRRVRRGDGGGNRLSAALAAPAAGGPVSLGVGAASKPGVEGGYPCAGASSTPSGQEGQARDGTLVR
jgi:hypothetical protein